MPRSRDAATIDGFKPVTGTARQPITNVVWLPRSYLHANAYNPNKVPPPELALLKISIQRSGWTQPIVVRPGEEEDSYEIVDGFHRWTVSGDPDVGDLTDGLVPCVVLRDLPKSEQMMATVRHNRARGNHAVLPMSDIVRDLRDVFGLTEEQCEKLMGMEFEEVDRLYDRGVMIKRGADALLSFNTGWTTK